MKKHRELADPTSCLSRAKDDEDVFVLLGRDVAAPDTIRYWVHCRIVMGKNKREDPQMQEALLLAEVIEREHRHANKTPL